MIFMSLPILRLRHPVDSHPLNIINPACEKASFAFPSSFGLGQPFCLSDTRTTYLD